jgi:hypothetical protein
MVAPGTRAPVASLTIPWIDPPVSAWPNAVTGPMTNRKAPNSKADARPRYPFFIVLSVLSGLIFARYSLDKGEGLPYFATAQRLWYQ